MMNYKRLLKAYLVHVYYSEGTTFLPDGAPCPTPVDDLTNEEREELNRINDEVENWVNLQLGARTHGESQNHFALISKTFLDAP